MDQLKEGKGEMMKHAWLTTQPVAVLLFMLVLLSGWGTDTQARNLNEILQQVEKNTPALKAAHAGTAMRESAVKQVRSGYFGEIDAVATNSNYDSDRMINPISYPVNLQPELFDDNQFGYGVSGRLPLDINGRITATVSAADKQLTASFAREGDVRLQVLHGTADLYHSLEGVRALEDALEKQIKALQTHVEVASVSIEVGRMAPVEKMRLVADLEGVKGKLAVLRGQEQGIRARITAFLGTASFTDSVPPVSGPPVQDEQTTGEIDERPDVQAMVAGSEAADAEVRAAFATRLPELGVNGSWLRNQGFDGDGDDTWAILVQLRLPLWDGGGRRAAVSRAESGRTVIRHELAVLRNRAKAEITAAHADLQAAKVSYQATIASVNAAQETARVQTDRFSEGRISAADLVDAEALLASARSDKALALTHWWQAEDHLRHAVGVEPIAYSPSGTTRPDIREAQ